LHPAGGSTSLSTKQLHAIAAQLDPDLIRGLPASFLPSYKTPCWHRKPQKQQQQLQQKEKQQGVSDAGESDPYEITTSSAPPAAAAVLAGSAELLQATQQLQEQQQVEELQCLPYFHILGSFQSGAFSLYSMLEKHPDVAKVRR
jgi:hypothetical protein